MPPLIFIPDKVNDVRVNLPASPSPSITVEFSGANILVMTDFDFWVIYNGHRVEVGVPDDCKGKLVGMCGNYDGDPSNDLMTANGNVTDDANEWGNSWNIDPRYVCLTSLT